MAQALTNCIKFQIPHFTLPPIQHHHFSLPNPPSLRNKTLCGHTDLQIQLVFSPTSPLNWPAITQTLTPALTTAQMASSGVNVSPPLQPVRLPPPASSHCYRLSKNRVSNSFPRNRSSATPPLALAHSTAYTTNRASLPRRRKTKLSANTSTNRVWCKKLKRSI